MPFLLFPSLFHSPEAPEERNPRLGKVSDCRGNAGGRPRAAADIRVLFQIESGFHWNPEPAGLQSQRPVVAEVAGLQSQRPAGLQSRLDSRASWTPEPAAGRLRSGIPGQAQHQAQHETGRPRVLRARRVEQTYARSANEPKERNRQAMDENKRKSSNLFKNASN